MFGEPAIALDEMRHGHELKARFKKKNARKALDIGKPLQEQHRIDDVSVQARNSNRKAALRILVQAKLIRVGTKGLACGICNVVSIDEGTAGTRKAVHSFFFFCSQTFEIIL